MSGDDAEAGPLARLRAQGFELPHVPPPSGRSYSEYREVGAIVHVSGQLPTVDGVCQGQGLLGRDVDVEEGRRLARIAAVNCLAAGAAAVGGLDRLRLVQVLVFVASAPGFGEQSSVAEGATALLLDVLGEDGGHARTAIGVAGLPRNSPVEIQMVCTTRADGAA